MMPQQQSLSSESKDRIVVVDIDYCGQGRQRRALTVVVWQLEDLLKNFDAALRELHYHILTFRE
jgi:hypothetical protein